MLIFLIAVGGAAGALARYGIDGWIQGASGAGFPWGTLAINVSGSLVLGFTLRLLEVLTASPNWRAALGIGFLGAYTTFSTFSFETARLLQNRQWLAATGNVTGNLVLGLIATFAGFGIAEWFLQKRG